MNFTLNHFYRENHVSKRNNRLGEITHHHKAFHQCNFIPGENLKTTELSYLDWIEELPTRKQKETHRGTVEARYNEVP